MSGTLTLASTVPGVRLRYGDAEEAFRAELVRVARRAHAVATTCSRSPSSRARTFPTGRATGSGRLFDAGWLVPGWPPELGGRNATASEQMIYFEEMKRREIPRSLNPQGLGIIAPSFRDAGTPEQQERWSAPDAARRDRVVPRHERARRRERPRRASRPRAVLDGDHFVVNGQKVWTSGAHHADWCMCFVRTDPDAPKHKGISVLIIDMKSPGVEPRPFAELTEPDYFDFNEVFFTDVVVPKENLLGELNQGWALTQGIARARAGDALDRPTPTTHSERSAR